MSLARFWTTHITICNALARGRKVFFATGDTSVKRYFENNSEEPRRRAYKRRKEAYLQGTLTAVDERLGYYYETIDFGIACDTIQPGDKVALICGVRTPLILRTTSETSKLVSPALIPGLMTGRGWNGLLNEEDFTKISLS